jgi:hypothetical protein
MPPSEPSVSDQVAMLRGSTQGSAARRALENPGR